MTSRTYNPVELKKRISACKDRLNALKDAGFTFSDDIYNDLEILKNNIIQPSLSRRLWRKRYQISIGILGIFFILAIVYILYFMNPTLPPIAFTSPPMTISVDNVYDGMIINGTYSINGTATHTDGKILLVQVKIDENPWENATGTARWSYLLNVDNIPNGYHILSFQCTDGQTIPVRVNKTIVIQREPVQERIPSVTIIYPSDGASDLTGIVIINGTASAANGEIIEIKIRFDNNPWITVVNATTTWHYNWETTTLTNGYHQISVQSFDIISSSTVISIGVYISNTHEPVIPPFPENGYFQLFFPPSTMLLKPNQNYEQRGYHRGREVPTIPRSMKPVYTTFEIDYKPDYLNVILPKDTIVTNPDEVLHNFSIVVSITDKADMNKVITLSLKCIFTARDPQKFPVILFKENYIYDIFFFTGQW